MVSKAGRLDVLSYCCSLLCLWARELSAWVGSCVVSGVWTGYQDQACYYVLGISKYSSSHEVLLVVRWEEGSIVVPREGDQCCFETCSSHSLRPFLLHKTPPCETKRPRGVRLLNTAWTWRVKNEWWKWSQWAWFIIGCWFRVRLRRKLSLIVYIPRDLRVRYDSIHSRKRRERCLKWILATDFKEEKPFAFVRQSDRSLARSFIVLSWRVCSSEIFAPGQGATTFKIGPDKLIFTLKVTKKQQLQKVERGESSRDIPKGDSRTQLDNANELNFRVVGCGSSAISLLPALGQPFSVGNRPPTNYAPPLQLVFLSGRTKVRHHKLIGQWSKTREIRKSKGLGSLANECNVTDDLCQLITD